MPALRTHRSSSASFYKAPPRDAYERAAELAARQAEMNRHEAARRRVAQDGAVAHDPRAFAAPRIGEPERAAEVTRREAAAVLVEREAKATRRQAELAQRQRQVEERERTLADSESLVETLRELLDSSRPHLEERRQQLDGRNAAPVDDRDFERGSYANEDDWWTLQLGRKPELQAA